MGFHEISKNELFDAVMSDQQELYTSLSHHSLAVEPESYDGYRDLESLSQSFSRDVLVFSGMVRMSAEMDGKKLDAAFLLDRLDLMCARFSLFPVSIVSEFFGESLVELVDSISILYQRHLAALSKMSCSTLSISVSPCASSVRTIEAVVVLIDRLMDFYESVKHEPLPSSVEKLIDLFSDQLVLLLDIRYEVSDQTQKYASELMGLETLLSD